MQSYNTWLEFLKNMELKQLCASPDLNESYPNLNNKKLVKKNTSIEIIGMSSLIATDLSDSKEVICDSGSENAMKESEVACCKVQTVEGLYEDPKWMIDLRKTECNEEIINKIFIKYNMELINYKYIEYENIKDVQKGSFIRYISKKNLIKKGGFLKEVKDPSVIELYNNMIRKKWCIYIDKYYLFYKVPNRNKLKNALQNLLDTNFGIKRRELN